MLPGITGSLIAGAFLERILLPELRRLHARDNLQPPFSRLLRWWRRAQRVLGPASGTRAVLDIAALPLIELLGYEVLHLEPYANGFVGSLGQANTALAVLRTTTWSADAESAWRDVVRASRTAHAPWGLVCTGRHLRLVDATRTWSRRALEFDLESVVNDERSATVLWALARRESLQAGRDAALLERAIERAETHGSAVCASLSDGVLEALTALVGAFDVHARGRTADPRATFQQAVTLVYRVLFLLFAEAREIVPTWHRVYREAYTIESLCRRIVRRPQARGAWAALQAISRLSHAGCRAGDLTVTAFNGRLFSPSHTPLAERVGVPDGAVSKAVIALATGPGVHGRQRISYADLGVEQLGAVYERVLEYEPSRANGLLQLARTSDERKATGSFYTPRAMTEFLVRRALNPLVTGRDAEQILNIRVLDPAMGSGAFLVAACRYLASSVEQALVAEGQWPSGDNVPGRRAELRRSVAQRCLYGVDTNPMAVQLARLSLWLTTLAHDRPLTFLDHHLAVGDSLAGAGLADLARRPRPGRRSAADFCKSTLPLFADLAADQMATRVLPDRFRLALEPADTVAAVRDKERALTALSAPGTPLSQWKTAADLWCAAWFWREGSLPAGVYSDVLASLLNQHTALSTRHRSELLNTAAAVAATHRFFHWELEFPEVFFDDTGRRRADAGFDAVLGNPPWDALRADTGDTAARDRARDGRQQRLRFFRDAGIYRHQGSGHANRYQLFVERALQLTRPGGRIAVIVPSGFATDHGSGLLRRQLFESVSVDRLIGFDNRSSIFPIHRDVKFLLLTGTHGGRTDRVTGTFGRSHAAWLDELPDAAADDPAHARSIVMSRSLIESWDPDNLAVPLLSERRDLDVLATVTTNVPALAARIGWGVRFGRELNATEDRHHFVPVATAAADFLRVIEGKHLEPFRVRCDQSAFAISPATAATLLDAKSTFGRRRLAYRDVASATNRVTLIAALLPGEAVSTHTVFCLKTVLGDSSQYCLLALLNSLVANYLVRLQVSTHVTTALMARLPVPRPPGDSEPFRELARLARSLEKTGIEANRAAYVRINTIAAHLYGLTPTLYEHVVGTFPLLPQSLRDECVSDYVRASETQRLRGK
jgi:hypothetical protein